MVAEQTFAAAADVEPDHVGEGKGGADGTEIAEPEGKLGTRSEEEVAERTPAASNVEPGAGSNNGAAAKGNIAIAKPSEKPE